MKKFAIKLKIAVSNNFLYKYEKILTSFKYIQTIKLQEI